MINFFFPDSAYWHNNTVFSFPEMLDWKFQFHHIIQFFYTPWSVNVSILSRGREISYISGLLFWSSLKKVFKKLQKNISQFGHIKHDFNSVCIELWTHQNNRKLLKKRSSMTWKKYVNVQVGERNWEGKRNHPSAVKGKQDWVTRREERKKKNLYFTSLHSVKAIFIGRNFVIWIGKAQRTVSCDCMCCRHCILERRDDNITLAVYSKLLSIPYYSFSLSLSLRKKGKK